MRKPRCGERAPEPERARREAEALAGGSATVDSVLGEKRAESRRSAAATFGRTP